MHFLVVYVLFPLLKSPISGHSLVPLRNCRILRHHLHTALNQNVKVIALIALVVEDRVERHCFFWKECFGELLVEVGVLRLYLLEKGQILQKMLQNDLIEFRPILDSFSQNLRNVDVVH